jgi:hypothetical protein
MASGYGPIIYAGGQSCVCSVNVQTGATEKINSVTEITPGSDAPIVGMAFDASRGRLYIRAGRPGISGLNLLSDNRATKHFEALGKIVGRPRINTAGGDDKTTICFSVLTQQTVVGSCQ